MRNLNRQTGLMARSLIGAVLLVYAAMAVGAERISLDSLQAQITSLKTENAAQAAQLQSQASTISALQTALNAEIANRKTYADGVGASTLASAKTYADGVGTSTLASSKTYADSVGTSTLASSKTYADGKVAPVADKLTHFSRNGNEIYITGANVNIRNGTGLTYQTLNGLGNLTIGYNEPRTGSGAVNTRTGSHNLVLGFNNNYSHAGAIVAGAANSSTNHLASIYGGTGNTSGGLYSAVVGGYSNSATGGWSTILGGNGVTAPNQLDHKP
jgi:hypothetical protein